MGSWQFLCAVLLLLEPRNRWAPPTTIMIKSNQSKISPRRIFVRRNWDWQPCGPCSCSFIWSSLQRFAQYCFDIVRAELNIIESSMRFNMKQGKNLLWKIFRWVEPLRVYPSNTVINVTSDLIDYGLPFVYKSQ